jgi:hypothetical protein
VILVSIVLNVYNVYFSTRFFRKEQLWLIIPILQFVEISCKKARIGLRDKNIMNSLKITLDKAEKTV